MFVDNESDNESEQDFKERRNDNKEECINERLQSDLVMKEFFVVFQPDKWLSNGWETKYYSVEAQITGVQDRIKCK
jgi:hypothetical protein